MRFLLATIDGGGTVPPELGLASRLVRRGHAVRVLALDRPSTSRLTEFYLILSAGGVLGGVFNALVAPLVFDRMIVLAGFIETTPQQDQPRLQVVFDVGQTQAGIEPNLFVRERRPCRCRRRPAAASRRVVRGCLW